MHIDFVSLKIGKTIGILISKIMTLCSLPNSSLMVLTISYPVNKLLIRRALRLIYFAPS